MVRILGINLKDNERIEHALTSIFGIGLVKSKEILKQTKIEANKRVKEISENEVKKIQEYVEANFKVEGELKSVVAENIKRLKEISSYRGHRHAHGLPTRGQRTRSNARTRKGKRRTIGALTKEAWAKIDQTQNKAK